MKTNKIIAVLLTVCIMGMACPAVNGLSDKITASASSEYTEGTYGVLKYRNYGNHIEISGCDKSAEMVEIPAEIDGLPVTSIITSAFNSCRYLTSLTIPDSVTSLGTHVFYRCEKLKSIKIPEGVTEIGINTFYNCCSLTTIEIPDSVTSIEDYAFAYCFALKSITIPDSVINIGDCVFQSCPITSITIPDSMASMGRLVFDGCCFLTSINVSENSENYSSIDGVLFNKDKTKLIQYPLGKTGTEYIIPDSVTSIEDWAFLMCPDLTTIVIPNNVKSIGRHTFEYCESLTSIEIPDSVTDIGIGAFFECTSLTSIIILNPECKIDDSKYTISSTATIYGYDNSTAQAYAEKCNRKFVSLGQAPEKDTVSLGDVNSDGYVNSVDASMVLVEYAELSTSNPSSFTEDMQKLADINKDDMINAVDATIILQYYAYLSTDGTDPIETFIASLDI